MPTGKRRQQSGISPIPCPVCGTEFTPYRTFQRACSRPCRDRLGPANDAAHAVVREFKCEMCGTLAKRKSTVGSGRFKWCDDCQPKAVEQAKERKNIARRLANHSDPEALRQKHRARTLSRYGITVEQFDQMHAAQDGKCALCRQGPQGEIGKQATLHVDHDHVTGKVRALLCDSCNLGIGKLRDDPSLLRRAADYIERYRQ